MAVNNLAGQGESGCAISYYPYGKVFFVYFTILLCTRPSGLGLDNIVHEVYLKVAHSRLTSGLERPQGPLATFQGIPLLRRNSVA